MFWGKRLKKLEEQVRYLANPVCQTQHLSLEKDDEDFKAVNFEVSCGDFIRNTYIARSGWYIYSRAVCTRCKSFFLKERKVSDDSIKDQEFITQWEKKNKK